MRTLIVYESQFGNTAEIAKAIAAELESEGPVELHNVQHGVPEIAGAALFIVGGPTQGHGVSKPLLSALEQLPPHSLDGVAAAAFDTRLNWPKFLSGSAADGIAHRLQDKGATMVSPPATFLVAGKEGPVIDGEFDRAHAWARSLAGAVPKEASVAVP